MQPISLAFVFFLLLWLAAMVFIYLKFDKEYKVSFYEKYYKVIPADYPPGEVSMLLYYDKIRPSDIMATLLNLVTKGYLIIVEEENFIFELGENTNREELHSHEAYLIDWLINQTGQLRVAELVEISESREKAAAFAEDYRKWLAALKKDTIRHDFFAGGILAKTLGRSIGILIIVISFFFILHFNMARFILTVALGVVSILYSGFVYKRTLNGLEQYEKWMAFKRFLKDFSVWERSAADLPAVWEKHLVYAISLGVAKDVAGKLPIFFTLEEWEDSQLKFLHIFYHKEDGLAALLEMLSNAVKAMENALLLAGERI